MLCTTAFNVALVYFIFSRLQNTSLISVLLGRYKKSFGHQVVGQFSWFSAQMRKLVKSMKR